MGKFELKGAANNKFMFNLKAGNGQVILTSELYNSKDSCLNGIESVKSCSSEDGSFDRRESKNGDPYFVLKAKNGQIIGKSEMYSSSSAMENGIRSCMENGPTSPTDDIS